MPGINTVFAVVDRMSGPVRTISENLVGMHNQLGEMNSTFGTFSSTGASSLVAIGAAAVTAVASIKTAREALDFTMESIALANDQIEAETKLTTVMAQRMNATEDEIASITRLASALQSVGVVGDEVAISGAQQLATFLNTTDALATLIPAMENLAAQQNGVNVTAENMVSIGNMFGKVMQGQTTALTRVGITFNEAQENALKYGTELERATVLAQVITDNVGQMNEALAQTPEGHARQLANEWSDLKETLGAQVMPAYMQLLDAVEGAMPAISTILRYFGYGASLAIYLGTSVINVFTWIAGGLSDLISLVESGWNILTGEHNSFLGNMFAAINLFAAGTTNIVLGLVNGVIGIGVSTWNLIASFANGLATVFNDPVAAIMILFEGMFDFISNIIQTAAGMIDTVLGTNMTGGLEAFQSSVDARINEMIGDARVTVMQKENVSDHLLPGYNYDQAINEGYEFGVGLENKLADMFAGGSVSDYVVPGAYSGELTENVSDIAGDTSNISKALDITSSQLKYIYDIANRDAINRFTTAEVKVDMTNYNTISDNADADGVVTTLKNTLLSEMASMAEGVH